MIKHRIILLICITSLMIISSCKKDSIAVVNNDSTYFPLRLGKYIIYNVDSIYFYDVTNTSDTFKFQIKEEIDSAYIDDTGNEAFYLKRYRRNNTGENWTLIENWSTNVNKERAEKVEENLRFIKMVFPIANNKTWKGNKYLNENNGSIYEPGWDYQYRNIDTTFNFSGVLHDSCVFITQYYDENAIIKDIEREAYSKNTGLIYKESIHVERQDIVFGSWIPEKGTIVILRAIEYN